MVEAHATRPLYLVWILLAAPWLWVTSRYLSGAMYYGEFLHATGEFSARLLMLALAVTPLRLLWPRQRWAGWLVQQRRYIGVAAFVYAVPHLIAYLIKVGSLSTIINEGFEPSIWTAWLGFVLLVPLAITSNRHSVRRLGRRWKLLHRLVYLAAVLTFAHWIMVAFNPTSGVVHASILLLLESLRVWKGRTQTI